MLVQLLYTGNRIAASRRIASESKLTNELEWCSRALGSYSWSADRLTHHHCQVLLGRTGGWRGGSHGLCMHAPRRGEMRRQPRVSVPTDQRAHAPNVSIDRVQRCAHHSPHTNILRHRRLDTEVTVTSSSGRAPACIVAMPSTSYHNLRGVAFNEGRAVTLVEKELHGGRTGPPMLECVRRTSARLHQTTTDA